MSRRCLPRLVTVVGVSHDVAGFRFTDIKATGMFLPTSVDVAEDVDRRARQGRCRAWPGRRSSIT